VNTFTTFDKMIEACVDHGVTERPPMPGQRYAGFAVHPRKPVPVVLAIAHQDGERFVIDLLRDGLTIEQAANLLKAYGIYTVTGADDEGDSRTSHAHAVAGVIGVLQERACLS
jgi:hypothetical protein